MGKFVIRKINTGIKLGLKVDNGEVIATSKVYEAAAACRNGVASVQKNALANGVKAKRSSVELKNLF